MNTLALWLGYIVLVLGGTLLMALLIHVSMEMILKSYGDTKTLRGYIMSAKRENLDDHVARGGNLDEGRE